MERSGPLRVAVLDDYQGVAMDMADWSAVTAEIVAFHEPFRDAAVVVDHLLEFDAIVAMRERTAFPRDVLTRLPNLRLLVTTGMRNAAIDIATARELGITVSGTRGGIAPTAELTWALILGLVRGVAEDDAVVRSGGWQTSVGGDLEGRTLGVIGLGRIGQRVASVGRAFGMDVIAWSPNLDADRARKAGATFVSRSELFDRSDVATIHLALGESTRGIIDARDLHRMKPTAILINTARAALVEQSALHRAITEGWFAALGFDVYEEEPLPPDHWLRQEYPDGARILRSPHMGYVTLANYRTFYGDAVEDIAAYLEGRPIRVLTV
ncbi:D-2-hydroxyacid dehydrogenase family protein [Agromyces sp. NPDC056523]|uniref:D-2-hydroxyacid dehydrogenase family protein n=1 Tax=Agromyces sp. NPDC056523 TaxID=3345850 RepID=UPI0036728D3D